MPPRVSVLMPVYNGARYLTIAVQSILAQSLRDFEFIVVDDGSTDDTASLLATFSDLRLRVFRIDHAGLVAALNAGYAQATGIYLARMDADDISHPHRLARQAEYLDVNPDVDVVTCISDLLDDQGQVVGRSGGGVGSDMLLELASGNGIVHGSVMMRRTSLPPPPLYPRAPEDYWLWVAMARSGKRFVCLPQSLYGFREHPERYSLSHARSQSAGILEVQWPLLEECSAARDLSRPDVRLRLLRGWARVACAAYRCGDQARGDIARRRFLDLVDRPGEGEFIAAIHEGIEAMIWGGCPWRSALRLRLSQWKDRPAAWSTYRNILLAIPPVGAVLRWARARRRPQECTIPHRARLGG